MASLSAKKIGKVAVDSEGFVNATLKSISETEQYDDKGRRQPQFEFIFAVANQNNKSTTDKYLWTSVNLNPEKYTWTDDESGEVITGYSKLTQLALLTGLLTEAELLSDEDFEADLESLIGQEFKFKLVPQRNKPNMTRIEFKTIQPLNTKTGSK